MSNVIKLKNTPQGQSRALGKHFTHSSESISNGAVEALTKNNEPTANDYAGLAVELFDAIAELEKTLALISKTSLLSIDPEVSIKHIGAIANKAIEDIWPHLDGVNINDIKTRRLRFLESALKDAEYGLTQAMKAGAEQGIEMPNVVLSAQKTVEHALCKNARISQEIFKIQDLIEGGE